MKRRNSLAVSALLLSILAGPASADIKVPTGLATFRIDYFTGPGDQLTSDSSGTVRFCLSSSPGIVGVAASLARFNTTTVVSRGGSAPDYYNIPLTIPLLRGGAKEPSNQAFTEANFSFTCGSYTSTQSVVYRWPSLTMSLVMDDTGSMGDELEGLKTAIAGTLAASSTINSFRNEDAYELISFKDNVTTRVPITTNVVDVINGIESLQPSGGGDCPEASNGALLTALNNLNADTGRAGRIIFATDASPTSDERVAINAKAKALHIPIDVLVTGDCVATAAAAKSQNQDGSFNRSAAAPVISAREYFKSIADATGGKFRYMPGATVDEYSEFLEQIINEGRYGYTTLEPGDTTLSGDAGNIRYFKVDVPANTRTLELNVHGGIGKIALLLKEGELPTDKSFDMSADDMSGSTLMRIKVLKSEDSSYYIKLTGKTKFVKKVLSVKLIK